MTLPSVTPSTALQAVPFNIGTSGRTSLQSVKSYDLAGFRNHLTRSPKLAEPALQIREEFLLFALPQMCMFENMLISNEKAPIRLSVRASLLGGCSGSFRISLGGQHSALLSIETDAGCSMKEEFSDGFVLPDLELIGTSLEGVIAASNDAGIAEIVIQPDKRWLQDAEEFKVFRLSMSELLSCVKLNTSVDLLIGVSR